MTIKRHNISARMSQAVVHGNTVYLAGQVAQNATGASITEQTRDILSTIDSLLETVGTSKSNILSATIYLVDMDSFAEMNLAWDAWVEPGHTPARACVQARLAAPQYGVEIMLRAALP